MAYTARRLLTNTCRTVTLVVLLLTAASTAGSRAIAQTPVTPSIARNEFSPDLHLRKLYLARPDLILYPIAFEVLC